MKFLCDFHLHSCLSPCGSLDSSPASIARAAKAAGLDAVALTDHNRALNAPAFAACCRRENLHALYGMEICTTEEIHCLALFETPEAALGFGTHLYDHLPRHRLHHCHHRMNHRPRSRWTTMNWPVAPPHWQWH